MGGTLDPQSLLNFLKASGGDSSGYGPPPSAPAQQDPLTSAMMAGPSSPAPVAPQQPQAGPRVSGIKGYLSNILYNMGETAKKQAGIPTDFEIKQTQIKNNLAQQQAQANLLESQAKTQLYNAQAGQIGHTVNIPGIGDVPLALAEKIFPAQITAQGRISAAQVQALARNSQVVMKAAYNPDGSLGVGLYDKVGNFKGYADNAIVPSGYLEKIHNGQTFKVNADGTLESIPTTSVSKPIIPGAPQAPAAPGAAPSTPPITPQTLQNQAAAKAGQSGGGLNAKPVLSGGQPFKTQAANDTVYAVDPKTNQTVATTRSDAGAQGLQITANKVPPTTVRNDQLMSNRIADIQRKIGDYADTFSEPISNEDRLGIAYLMDHNVGAGLAVHGLSLNVLPGYLQQYLKSNGMGNISEPALKRYVAYAQAQESLAGYQKVLTGGSHSSDKLLDLQQAQLPKPTDPEDAAKMMYGQFQQNIDLAAQHIPIFPGSGETQQSIKAEQIGRRQQAAAIQNNFNKGVQQNFDQRQYQGKTYQRRKGSNDPWQLVQ